MAVAKIDPKVIFASEAPAQDTPAVFTNKTVGWGESRKNGGRPTIKQSNALQQETDLKILWLNENSVTPFDATIDYPENAVTLKDDVFKILKLGVWEVFLDKSSVGLINVDNTSDLNKPVSTATQTALNLKADKSATYTKVEVDNAIDLLRPPYLSSDVVDGNQTQDQINLYGGKKYDMPVGGYQENERVVLANGDIVKSTIDGNVNNPNVNMTGWVNIGNAITVETIADMLSIQNPVDGMTTNVKGYHTATNFALAQPYKGGDLFYYVPSLSTINNGVTIFNGWVRDTSDKLLTTDDAGLLGDGTDSNATVRLQNIFSAVGDGFTIQVIGKYTINQHVMAYRKKDLKIVGVNSDIQGDPDNWAWSTSHIVPDVPFYHPRGMLMAYECPNVHFTGLKIKGINRPNRHAGADQWQDGDCAIHTYLCNDATFSNNITTNNFAWGICNENGNNGTAYGNNVSYCTHQSGINICNGANEGVARVYDNHISECGLYGIEYENRNTYEIDCHDNTVTNSYAGLMALSDNEVISGSMHDNTVYACLYGIYPTNIFNERTELSISLNKVRNSEYAINLSSGSGLDVVGNILHGFYIKDTYLHISPSNFVAQVLAPNKFLTHKSLVTEFGAAVGSIYYVEEQQLTISALAVNTAPWSYGNTTPSDFYVITVAENILNETFLFKHLKRKYTAGSRCYMGIQSLGGNKNNVINGNTIRGFNYGFVKDNAQTSPEYNEVISSNTFLDGNVDVLNPAAAMGVKYIGNTFTGNLGFHRDLVEQGNVTLHPVVSQKLGISRATTGEAIKSATIYLPQKTRINAVSISVIGMNTTGKLRVGINGETLEAVAVGNNLLLYCHHLLNAGAHAVTISDSVGDLTYTDVFLGLLTT